MKTSLRLLICTVTVILLACSHHSYGQFALGFRIGYNANKLTTNVDSIKSDFNSGFHVGVWSHFGKRLYFAPELRYTLSGGLFTEEGNVSTQGWKQKVTVGSLDVPLMLGFKIVHSKMITWRIEAGPMMSIVVNEKVKDVNSVTGPLTAENINKANWYIMAGTGIDVLFMNLDIRYQYGLNAIVSDVTKDGKTYNVDAKNSLISVSLGFKIFGSK